MQITLSSRGSRSAFLVIALFVSGAYAALTTTEFVGWYLASTPRLNRLLWASRVQPWNAEYRHQLGRFEFLVARSPGSAVQYYQEALALNPHDAHIWFDLATVLQTIGDTRQQTNALQHAAAVDPMRPQAAWELASLYVVSGDTSDALREFKVAIQADPSITLSALRVCRHFASTDALLHGLMPTNAPAYYQLLALLEEDQKTADAVRAWSELIRLHQSLEQGPVFDYIRYLLSHHEPSVAEAAWRDATEINGQSAYQPSPQNLIVNGDFGLDPLNGGFDWTYEKRPGVSLALDPTEFHTGNRSLRIVFDGQPIADVGLHQFVAVKSKTTYELSGFFKAADVLGAGGARIAVRDAYSNQMYFASDNLRDADFWKPVSGTFTTAADTGLLILRVERDPANSPMKGKLWIDGLRLRPVP